MAKERVRVKREQAAQVRDQHKRAKRRQAIVRRAVGGVVLAGLAGGVGYCAYEERQLSSVLTTATYAAGQHLSGRITYKETPPLGGPHNVVWQNCGIYEAPIHSEHAVHALEHGAIWITYRPDLAAEEIARLKTLAADDYMLLSLYPGLPSPVVASAWNNQIGLTGADDARLGRFITRFKNNPSSTPEFGAPCTGGTTVTADADSLQTSGPMVR